MSPTDTKTKKPRPRLLIELAGDRRVPPDIVARLADQIVKLRGFQ